MSDGACGDGVLSTEKRDYMSKRKKIKTTKEQIVEYWEAEVDECGFSEAHERCSRSGCKRHL